VKKMITKQPISAKRGEVRLRAHLARQHIGKKTSFPQEYTNKEMLQVITKRAQKAHHDFKELVKQKITLSPFLEIGAEYGQASLVLVNKLQKSGIASDIALDPILRIKEIAKKLKMPRIPQTVIFDAESIPFPNNSFPFVFCYQTLHHFPRPLAVTREIERVLIPGGVFFFGDEPVAQALNLPLWHRPTKLRWWEKILKFTLILPFISKIGKTEIDHGILEKSFSISEWKSAFGPFESLETLLEPFPFGPKGSLEGKNILNRFFLFSLGGGIKGIAKKKGKLQRTNNIPQFCCLNCNRHKPALTAGRLALRRGKLVCLNCKQEYTKRDGVWLLLPKKLKDELYK